MSTAQVDTVHINERHPPLHVDLSYATISLASTTVWSILSGWMLYFYLPPDGQALVPPALYGIAVLSVRAINALLAAPIGFVSDRTRSRWGRRLPFMFASALPMILFFVLMWTPPTRNTSGGNLIYMALIFMLYNTAYSVNQITFTALLPELAQTDRHRVRMSAWSSSFFVIGMVASSLVGPLIGRVGYAGAALIYGLIALPLFYLPMLALHERTGESTVVPERVTIRQSMAALVGNPAFRTMTATGILYWCTTVFIQGIIPFMVTEICGLSEADTPVFYIPALAGSLLCYPLITWLSNQVGKWRVFAGSLLASAFVLPGLMLIGDWLPVPLLAQGIVWITLQAVAMSGVTMLPPAFGAEIADDDAQRTGMRREGLFYATWGLLDQATTAAGAALLSWLLLLGRSHTDPHGPLGVRLVGVVGGVLMLVAFLIFLRYPLRHRSQPERRTR